jgi:hypothetical protein
MFEKLVLFSMIKTLSWLIVGSLYSFASIGGLAHEGVTTIAETELILKNTTSLLFYINYLLKNNKAS